MNETAVTLYSDSDYFSPYVMSVFVTLEEKGIPFTLRTLNLGSGEHFDASYAAKSLTRRVPTLEIDGFSLSESNAIIEYLEEAYRPPAYPSVFPQDIKTRAGARQIQAWVRSDLAPIRDERPTAVVFGKPTDEPLSQIAQAAAQKLLAAAEQLIPANRPNLFESWCIADTDLAMMLNRLVANGDPVPEKVENYVASQWARPSVQKWVALSDQKLAV